MEIIYLIISLLIAIALHEAGHAYVASVLGDPTAKMQGRVTLNPIKHLDPIGTFMIFVTFLSGFGIGWGKPVPVNPYNFKDFKKGEALTAAAGPLTNFILALIASFPLRYFPESIPVSLFSFLQIFILLNVGLMCFNLIPVPPLDGSKILFMFLPNKYYHYREDLERKGPIILIGAIIIGQLLNIPILSWLLLPLMNLVFFLLGLS
jgi:Zn-dependent protease